MCINEPNALLSFRKIYFPADHPAITACLPLDSVLQGQGHGSGAMELIFAPKFFFVDQWKYLFIYQSRTCKKTPPPGFLAHSRRHNLF